MISRLPRFLGFLASALLALSLAALASDTLQTGRQQFEQGQFAAAAKTLEEGLAAKSQDAALHYWLGRTYFELRDVDRAFEHAERAVQLEPQNSEYHLWYGHACGRKARRSRNLFLARRVKKEFEEAVRLDSASIPARRALVDYLASAPWIAGGSDGEARRQADTVAAQDPVEGHLAWADYWSGNEKPDQAAEEMEKALELKPGRIEPYVEAGEFFVEREDAVHLQSTVEGAERVNGADARLQYFRGVLWILQGARSAEAEQSLLKYVTSVTPRTGYPPRNAARIWLGRLYEKLSRCNDAVQQYRGVLVEEPENDAALAGYKRTTQKCK